MKTVAVITTALFDEQGKDFILGGNERYLLDVLQIYKDMGLQCNVYQPSKRYFKKEVGTNLIVEGVPFDEMNRNSYLKLNKIFHSRSGDASIAHYQSFTLAYPYCHSNSIGICHGVSWDRPVKELWGQEFNLMDKMKHNLRNRILIHQYYKAGLMLKSIVANDTNFINWARTSWPDLVDKMIYMPNYVDTGKFLPRETCNGLNSVVTILFPRRLSPERGYYIALDAAECLLNKHSNVEFVFTGVDNSALNKLSKHPRVKFTRTKFDEMAELYRTADIVIIPTIHSEGTSLSCLEAMACAIPVIASNVGGLTNIIIDGFNGLLINPTVESLVKAIDILIDNTDLRKNLAINGYNTISAFNKDKWMDSWQEVIYSMI